MELSAATHRNDKAHHLPKSSPTAWELDQAIAATIADIQADIDLFEESAAIRAERDDPRPTTERAMDALYRSERFAGEHHVAMQWLMNYAPNSQRFRVLQ